MLQGSVGLIGFGAIGTPIAHKLYNKYHDRFILIASGKRREKLQNQEITINGEKFHPTVVSSKQEVRDSLQLLIVCVKNYQLMDALGDIRSVISEQTIILPLQNGISSYEFFSKEFPDNIVLQGYVQGPNTRKTESDFEYTNPGVMHIGDQVRSILDIAADVYAFLNQAGIEVHLEQDIRLMVWKKWMLNVAGNSVTALTNADYKDFKDSIDLQTLCVSAMREFVAVAQAEGIQLTETDIQDVIDYYVNYKGSKRTSMLEDVSNRRKTENDYLAGKIVELSKKHSLETPIISSLYLLMKIKEVLYLNEENNDGTGKIL